MNLSPRRREEPEVNLTSLIDVVFLLLIFFMVSTSFIREASLSLQLPTAASAPAPEQPQTVEIVVGADGRYFFGDRELVSASPATLRRALLAEAESDTGRTLVIRADGRAPHQAVVTVMDVAGRAGFQSIHLATARHDDD